MNHITVIKQALDALEVNHKWHSDYDELDAYQESEIYALNTVALTALRAAIEQQAADSDYQQACESVGIEDHGVQPASEPVATVRLWTKDGKSHGELVDWHDGCESLFDGIHKLYAAPVSYVPLSDEKWQALQDETGEIWSQFTRDAIERAVRGIK